MKKSILLLSLLFIFHVALSQASNLEAAQAKQKVALLFLTREDLNFPDIWEKELRDCEDQYNIYIHAKAPMHHPFFKNLRISKIVPNTWLQHTKAWQALIQEAVKNPENVKFVLLSESCMPLYPLSTIYHVLTRDSLSYMEYKRPWWPANQPREVHAVPKEHRYGSMEFIVLNQDHAGRIAADRSVINMIARYPLDMESYFPTFFSLQHCLSEMVNCSYIYINWDYRNKKSSSPYTFEQHDSLSEELIQDAYQQGHLFLRKVAKEFPEHIWRSYMDAAGDYTHERPSKNICPLY